jgi:2-oxoglutarate dehydrogenase E2 component (dihydrolipoamide succinyltransferase)
MKQDVIAPSPGESISQGILAVWLKPDGATVEVGEEIFEFESDKATLAVPATAGGLLRHVIPEGEEVSVGQVVATIDTDSVSKHATGHPPAEDAPAAPTPRAEEATLLSTAVRDLAETHSIDVSAIEGSGKDGRILKKDIMAVVNLREAAATPPPAASEPAPAAPPAKPVAAATPPPQTQATRSDGRETRKPMSSIRKRIAENLVRAQKEAALLSTFNEVDMSRIMHIRKQYGEAFLERHGVKLGFMSLFVKAVCRALASFPEVNTRIDGDEIVYHNRYDIGVAVSTERGLVVPVIRDAEQKNFAAIEAEIKSLAEKARDKKLTVDELTGGVFTITNGGIFGSLLSTPIPTPPQTAILGMHTIQKRATVVGDAIEARPMMYLALTYDHRVIDGKQAVGFLVAIKQIVEDPQGLLFDL